MMSSPVFLVMGLLYLVLGVWLGPIGVPMVWLGASLFTVGVAYVLRAPQLLGKRADGSFHPLALVFYAPFLASAWLGWQLRRRRHKEVWNEIASGLYLGRMATATELPPGTTRVIDLTAELVPSRAVRQVGYRCLPTLDGGAPEREAFWALATELARHDGAIFIHCAAGRGRSATLAAAVLLERGLAPDPAAAIALLKSRRPRVQMSASQTELLVNRAITR